MEPTAAKKDSIMDLGTLLDWAGLFRVGVQGGALLKISFMQLWGGDDQAHLRVIAKILGGAFSNVLHVWQVDGNAPTEQAGLAGKVARAMLGLELPADARKKTNGVEVRARWSKREPP